ncbi:hypothetical protein DFH06DRAFT_1145014 [Mycena polygramma]|nr:hypothetical protein DFH06DRAFT_1145014 [Mycena polygramma]
MWFLGKLHEHNWDVLRITVPALSYSAPSTQEELIHAGRARGGKFRHYFPGPVAFCDGEGADAKSRERAGLKATPASGPISGCGFRGYTRARSPLFFSHHHPRHPLAPTRQKRVKSASKCLPMPNDSLSARQLMDFRNYLFTPTYIAHNAAKFLDHEWVDIGELRKYLQQTAATPPPIGVKIEAMPPLVTSVDPIELVLSKWSPWEAASRSRRRFSSSSRIRIRSLTPLIRTSRSLPRFSPPLSLPVRPANRSSKIPDGDYLSDDDFDANQPSEGSKDDDSDLEESDTVWQDDCTSFVCIGKFRVNQRLSVERVEYPVIYPIHRTPAAIVVELVNATNRDPSTQQFRSVYTSICVGSIRDELICFAYTNVGDRKLRAVTPPYLLGFILRIFRNQKEVCKCLCTSAGTAKIFGK